MWNAIMQGKALYKSIDSEAGKIIKDSAKTHI